MTSTPGVAHARARRCDGIGGSLLANASMPSKNPTRPPVPGCRHGAQRLLPQAWWHAHRASLQGASKVTCPIAFDAHSVCGCFWSPGVSAKQTSGSVSQIAKEAKPPMVTGKSAAPMRQRQAVTTRKSSATRRANHGIVFALNCPACVRGGVPGRHPTPDSRAPRAVAPVMRSQRSSRKTPYSVYRPMVGE